FFKPLIAEAGEAFRGRVLDLLRQARKSRITGRPYISLRLQMGSDTPHPHPHGPVRFNFHGQMDEDGLLERLRAADALVRSLRSELFTGGGRSARIWVLLGQRAALLARWDLLFP